MNINQNEKQEEKDSSYSGFTKIDAPIIHIMPRRFLNAKVKATDSHKGMGFLIFGIGIIILIAGGFFVYYFVFNSNSLKSSLINKEPEVITNISNEEEKENINKIINEEEKEFSEKINNNTQSNQKEDEENSSSMVKIEKEETQKENIISTTTVIEKTSTSTEVNVVIKPKENNKKVYLKAQDLDSDGLSDMEEMILQTKKNEQDTDGDTYSDLSELKNFYNPAGEGRLLVNSQITRYLNEKFSYSLYLPKNWQIDKNINGDTSILKIDDTQFIQIIVLKNEKKTTLADWYKEQFDVVNIKNEQKVYKEAWEGFKDESGLIFYLSPVNQSNIFVINYNVPEGGTLYYKNLFQLIIDSFEI